MRPSMSVHDVTVTSSPPSRRGLWPMRDLPVVGWLVATVVVAIAHPFVPAPRWLLIHLLLLGAASHAILVWSRHFADALLHLAPEPGDRTVQGRRLALLNLGALAVVAGVVTGLWPVVVAGATGFAGAVAWHGLDLFRRLRAALPARFETTVPYYVAAACLLPVGAGLGTALARIQTDPWHDRLIVAHATVNVLGWLGLTVAGTLTTLWPTMLRSRVATGAERRAAQALPPLVGGVVLTAAGPLLDLRAVSVVGLLGYLVGLSLLAGPVMAAARARRPASFATFSTAAGMLWLVACLVVLVPAFATAGSWAEAGSRFTWLTPFLAAGFGAQVLIGALSFLVPMVLGGGAAAITAATQVLNRAATLRVVSANAGLLVCVLPVPAGVRVFCSVMVLVALASFLPLLVGAIRASRAVSRGTRELPALGLESPFSPRGAVGGLVIVLVASLTGVAVDAGGLDLFRDAPPVSAGVSATGVTRTVTVEAKDMRLTPSTIEIAAGDALVIKLVNADDEDVHDLVLDSGAETGRLSPGASARLDVGVVGRDVAGWCSVLGHHQMGMVLTIDVLGVEEGGGPAAAQTHTHVGHGHDSPAVPAGEHAAGFRVHDASLPPIPAGRVHRRTIHVREVTREVAPGVTQRLWTFDGTTPGPTLHGRVGDRFVITLVNHATVGHSIDFHAGVRAPDRVMRTIPPGERLVYRFTAERAGIWMYHCSTMPMAAHIANGLFGAVVIEPRGLPRVDRSFALVQSELYLGPDGGEVDLDKLAQEEADLVVFNGYANQYDGQPLRARVGDRVRIWVLDAGPSRGTSFHVVGGQFDATYAEGAWLLRRGSSGGAQSLALAPAQGGFVELTLPEPGRYPFLSHSMVDAERGAHGVLAITGPGR
jgi:nitrite reductase (NO-forming)